MHPTIQERLFSRLTTVILLAVLIALLVASVVTYRTSRDMQSVSLSGLRMASWNLARLEQEANAFDKEYALAFRGVGDADAVTLRYDILWSRFTYLLDSDESAMTRHHADNRTRLRALFDRLRAMETSVLALRDGQAAVTPAMMETWLALEDDIEQMLIDNFVGGRTNALMADIDTSRRQLERFRTAALIGVSAIIAYLLMMLVHLRHRSRIDWLTGLPNRNRMREMTTVSPTSAVISCQILGYRALIQDIGDSGSQALTRTMAQRLKAGLTPHDRLILIAPDEFAIIASGDTGRPVTTFLDTLSERLAFEWQHDQSRFPIQAIAGVDLPVDPPLDLNSRHARAVLARQSALQHRRPLAHYSDDLHQRRLRERTLLNDLIDLFDGQPTGLTLDCHYQPMVPTDRPGAITGVEVLLRGDHERFGAIPPNQIVDLCERHGLGRKLGLWLFDHVARECHDLVNVLGFKGVISINLNPGLIDERLVEDVRQGLIGRGLPAESLCLEITEDNAALDFERVNALLERVSELGVGFALDDFGTGHSSLAYVRQLRIHRLKVDRCFVEGIDTLPVNRQFMESILDLARHQGMGIVVEGVETRAQWATLAAMGPVWIQGYYRYRPMPLTDLMKVLIDSRSDAADAP